MAAVQTTWSYAQLSAWTYLHDEALGADIMEAAIKVIYSYAQRTSPMPPVEKLTARLRSQIRRVAKQMANRRRKEENAGSVRDLELAYNPSVTPDPTDTLLIKEVLDLLSPRAREVATWIWMGYSWREIGQTVDVDHNSIRLAFHRETDAALTRLGRGMRVSR
jgi:DNA-binding NarL/FixJ family response regulator